MQKQLLWHTFQEKNKQLELQHQMQLEVKYQVSVLLRPSCFLQFNPHLLIRFQR